MNVKYLHLFRYLISALFIFWMQIAINPDNIDPIESPDGEKLFNKDIE